ncbi:hypothetical protein CUJ83_01845 [Methanocella sp. CWC-04]|uniref:MtN3 and saliva related transmembrane protein n=1 Tax=Methanooceanicella nereidis TaxID=2052831 RepID=A0AAP2RB16_9EURY|nr:hypothetical protein [Methanocella sp. CWC-04]
MDSIMLIGLVAGALTTSSSIPQVVRIIKTKSAKDVSGLFFIMMGAGMSLWLIYGIIRSDTAIILWNAVSLMFCMAILGLKKLYG